MDELTQSERNSQVILLSEALRTNRWIPDHPLVKQAQFLLMPDREVLFGGSAGPGKTYALLAGGVQFADVPGFKAVILRRTYSQLSKPDAVMFTSMKWLMGTAAKWNAQDRRWTFPSGAVLVFSHLQHDQDIYNHQGAQYDYIGFDELMGFYEKIDPDEAAEWGKRWSVGATEVREPEAEPIPS